jgi:hypothetical protein
VECPGRARSSVWMKGVNKGIKTHLKKCKFFIMECVYIYRYIAFALGVLSLVCLIGYLWKALHKIHRAPVR